LLLSPEQVFGLLNIHKPPGPTSHDVVALVRRGTRVRKVGHAGTLDPFATGVLLVCFASATKRVSRLMELEKEYQGTIELGTTTDSHDATGEIVSIRAVPPVTPTDLENIVTRYRGTIWQTPPRFSAIKKGGRRMYKLARAGKPVALEPRRVTIHSFDIVRTELPILEFRLTCSRGTYVRALARDIGNDLGCGAFLKTLRRTRVGPYAIDQSLTVEQFVERLTD